MKLISLTIALFISLSAFAQTEVKPPFTSGAQGKGGIIRICAPSRGQLLHPPLYLIYSHKQLIFKSDTSGNMKPLNMLNPNHIKSINVVKDSASLSKYGGMAKNGVIEIYLDDEKDPEAYKVFKTDSAKVKPGNR